LRQQITKMKKFLLLLAAIPAIGFAQTSTTKSNSVSIVPAKASDEFIINGNITGIPDNTPVNLLNPNNGAVEATGNVVGNKFTLRGKIAFPDFKVLSVNSQPPYLNIFLDNSDINITGSKEGFENAVITGSPSHNQFAELMVIIKANETLFSGAESDETKARPVMAELEKYIAKYPSAYITPLAIFRHHQLSQDAAKLEQMFTRLDPPVKSSPIGNYLAKMIEDDKKIPIGKPAADFSQADPEGKMISLSSYRGKYVLVDFWASWCGPCRQENPNVVATYNKFKDKNFTVFGVSLDKAKDKWLEAIKADNLGWMHVSDLQGWGNAVAAQFGITSIPQNFLVDPKGNVVAKNLRGPALEAKLAQIIK
jgi:peroxiredoxin